MAGFALKTKISGCILDGVVLFGMSIPGGKAVVCALRQQTGKEGFGLRVSWLNPRCYMDERGWVTEQVGNTGACGKRGNAGINGKNPRAAGSVGADGVHPRVLGLAKNEVIEHRFITPRLIKASNSAGQ